MSSSPRPQVEISPTTREDFEPLAHDRLTAMKEDAVYLRMFPLSLRPSHEERMAFEIKATLPGSSKPVGFACWRGPVEKTATIDFLKSFLGESAKAMREIMQGKEFWYLGMLFIDPAYQGLGIASALLNFGISRADDAGLPFCLENSTRGQDVYRSKGFEVMRTMEIDDENEEGGS
ncbi:acyl-CoA N-acyltransferase [Mrakia frigida]|uniref:GNAT family N-acetyltransferase n=1 Tax=Mrakia frigida TaxID=29902 RepID=UPI003FCC0633